MTTDSDTAVAAGARCANCETLLTGRFCSACGQAARDFHRPVRALVSEYVAEFVTFDTRLFRTLRPLLFSPGTVTREYLAGHRVTYLPPLRAYLYAALLFFGLFTVFETKSPPVYVVTSTAAADEVRQSSARGARIIIGLPERIRWVDDRHWTQIKERAQANPDAFALVAYRNIPRAFVLFVPIGALLLELFYRKQGYYIDHLVFALYHHALLFLGFAAIFAVWNDAWLPDLIAFPARWVIGLWFLACFPLALRRVYGGTWLMTALKSVALAALYLVGFFFFGMVFIVTMAVLTF